MNLQTVPLRDHVAITRKMRDRLTGGQATAALSAVLTAAPFRGKHLYFDLKDAGLRQALATAIGPMLNRQPGIPPALVGSARRVQNAINEYERQISNYDLFETINR